MIHAFFVRMFPMTNSVALILNTREYSLKHSKDNAKPIQSNRDRENII